MKSEYSVSTSPIPLMESIDLIYIEFELPYLLFEYRSDEIRIQHEIGVKGISREIM